MTSIKNGTWMREKIDPLARKTPDNFPRTPKRMRKKQHHRPAARLAHLVMAMTPLFYPLYQMVRWGQHDKVTPERTRIVELP